MYIVAYIQLRMNENRKRRVTRLTDGLVDGRTDMANLYNRIAFLTLKKDENYEIIICMRLDGRVSNKYILVKLSSI